MVAGGGSLKSVIDLIINYRLGKNELKGVISPKRGTGIARSAESVQTSLDKMNESAGQTPLTMAELQKSMKKTGAETLTGGRLLVRNNKIWQRQKFRILEGKSAIDFTRNSIKKFNFEQLSIMFFMASVTKAFSGLTKAAFQAAGVFQIWSESLKLLFLPVALAILPWALKFLNGIISLSPATKKFVGWVVLLGGALAGILGLIATVLLFANGLSGALATMGFVIGVGGIAGSVLALIGGFAALLIVGVLVSNWVKDMSVGLRVLVFLLGLAITALGILLMFTGPVGIAIGGVAAGAGIGMAGGAVLGGRQFGGSINKTGLYHLEAGETILPPGATTNTFAPSITVFGSEAAGADADGLARRIGEIVFDQLREAGLR